MKSFFEDIFRYHHHFNQKITEQLIENQEIISNRSVPLLSHVINAHHIWNARILGLKPECGVNDVHTLSKILELNEANLQSTLRILESINLTEPVQYRTFRGDGFENTVQDILFHIANHTTHHRGQVISDLRQSGIAPVMTDYIFYKR